MRAVPIICLVLICLLGLPAAAAQDHAQRQHRNPPIAAGAPERPTPEHTPSGSAVRDDPARYFDEDFSSATLDSRNWELVVGATPARGFVGVDELAGAVRLGLGPLAGERLPELRSAPISLAGVPGVELRYTLQQSGVELGEALVVEYLAVDSRWYIIERVVADGRDSIGFVRHVRLLPVKALHERFRVRFRPAVDDQDDAWILGEVSVAAYDPLQTLAVRVHPAHDAHVEVVLAGRPDAMSFSAPFTRRFPLGAPLLLVPQPTIETGVFSHWSVDGGARIQRQRVLRIELTEELEAVAHYRPRVAGRNAASVAIVSEPLPGVSIALGVEPEPLFTKLRSETEYPCLTGEWLTLLAPLRTERMVFVGWVVNGERLPSGDNLLEHRVTADDILLAEYVRLGDVNGDDLLDKYDVDLFLAALIDPAGYAEVYPDLDPLQRGDVNGDGVFDELDIEGFVDLLLND